MMMNLSQSRERGQRSSPVDIKGCNFKPASSWKNSFEELSKNLQLICGSPDCQDTFFREQSSPSSRGGSPSSQSPSILRESPLSFDMVKFGRSISVRHEQSEERLREKLSTICQSPQQQQSQRRRIRSDEAKSLIARRTVLKKLFRASVDIGEYKAEDLRLDISHGVLSVYAIPKKSKSNASPLLSKRRKNSYTEILLQEISLPADLQPNRLMCILRDGVLDVKVSPKRPRQTSDCLKTVSEYSPLVIDHDGSAQIKLVLQMPEGLDTRDIKVKCVDEQLLVSAKSSSDVTTDLMTCQPFDRMFVLPETVDPFSISAHVNEDCQLIIQASLAPRGRCYTM